jgi:ribosome maturation factor RimP
MSDAVEQIQRLLDPILESLGLSLWDIEFRKQGPTWLLRIYIDRESGEVTLGDCEAVSRDLGIALDVEDFIKHSYTLEVSSPGLDRALTKPEHYSRFTGSTVKIKTYEAINGQKAFRGILHGIADNMVKAEVEGIGVLEIPLSNISKISLEVDF